MKRFFKSWGFAFDGLIYFFKNEKNGQLELVAAIIAIVLGFYFTISPTEWFAILLCIGGVLALEMLNSSLEKLCDHLHPEKHNNIKIVKDIAAAAVTIFSIISLVIGLIVFLPRLTSILHI